MSDPAEVLQWHDEARERSDASFRRRLNLAYKDPAPLNLSTQEMWDWLEEMQPEIDWQEADEYVLSGVYLTLPEMGRTFGKTLNDAVCLAAAKWKRINNEI